MKPAARHNSEGKTPSHRSLRREHPLLGSWTVAWIALSVVGFLWAVANPLGNSPDEPAHISRAASLVRGHPMGSRVPGQLPVFSLVQVPRTYALVLNGGGLTGAHNCYHFQPRVPASCDHIAAGSRTVPVTTYVGRYPPLYYAVVGLPSLLTNGTVGLYLMRMTSVLLSASLLALAVAAAQLWSSSGLLAAAVLVVATPTELFLAASVNPNGLEIAAAVCVWTTGAVLVLDQYGRPPRGLVVALAGASCVLALTRPISALWLLIAFITLGGAGWRRLDPRALLRRRDVQLGAVAIAASCVFSVIWVVAAHALYLLPEGVPPPGTPMTRIVTSSVSSLWTGLGQAAGTFGWLDTQEPEIAVFGLVLALSIPIVMCLAWSGIRDRSTVGLLSVASAVVPLLLVVIDARRNGVQQTQGRYFMPLWVGPPLLAAALQGGLFEKVAARLRLSMVLSAGIGLVLGFWWNVHRTTVGIQGPYLPWRPTSGSWAPPLPATVLDVLMVPAVALYMYLVLRPGRRPAAMSSSPTEEGFPDRRFRDLAGSD